MSVGPVFRMCHKNFSVIASDCYFPVSVTRFGEVPLPTSTPMVRPTPGSNVGQKEKVVETSTRPRLCRLSKSSGGTCVYRSGGRKGTLDRRRWSPQSCDVIKKGNGPKGVRHWLNRTRSLL